MLKVGLFVTCLAEMFRPRTAFAALALLERAGCEVIAPRLQTCCGQPAFNSGDSADARKIAKKGHRRLRGFRLCRGPFRLLHGHDQAALSGAFRRRSSVAPARGKSGGEGI
ncbi:protein of unknown function [Methylocella tundrae]|uniref:Cysteine-rich domain-containing protein n=1 Tax=Methylocella tundrae TaxID=227605 RepID=A0A4V6IMS5_METTU|nr:protein of unknown function [Methylocella tundrae]